MSTDSASSLLSLEIILETIAEITLQIQQCQELEIILQRTIAHTRSLLQTDRVLLCRFLEHQGVVVYESVSADYPSTLGQPIDTLCLHDTWIQHCGKKPITILPDLHRRTIDPCDVHFLEGLQMPASLVVPLFCQDTPWGVLLAHHYRSVREWQPLEKQLLQHIALPLGVAIQQAALRQQHLNHQLERHTVDQPPAIAVPPDHLYQQLQASEAKLKSVLENVNASVTSFRMFANQDYEYDYISSGCEVIFGYSPQAFKRNKQLWLSRVLPEDQERVRQQIAATVFTAGTSQMEYRFRHRDGSLRWISETLVSRWQEAENCWAVTLISTDISAAKLAESARKQKEDLIRNIAQGVSGAVGDAFFHSLVQYLIRLLEMDQAFVGALVAPANDRIQVIAGLSNGRSLDGLEYPLINTPCEQVIEQGFCLYAENIQQRFPDDRALQTLGGEGYVGISLTNASGAVIGVISVISNRAITNVQFIQEVLTIFAVRAASELERQKAEALLHRYERIVAATPDMVSVIDRHYVYQVVNQTYLTWNQKAYDEVVGHSVSDLLGQTFFETRSKPYLDRCLAGGLQQSFEIWQHYGDGQQRYIRATYAPYIEVDGTISGVVINVHDLTDLKQAETALRESEERFQEIAKTIPQMFFVRSLNSDRYDYISPAYETLWGRSREELQRHPLQWMDAIHPDDRSHVEAAIIAQKQGYNNRYDYRIVRPDGSIRWIAAAVSVVRDDSGTPLRCIGLAEDITDRKIVELALLEQQQFTEQIAESTLAILYVYDLIEQRNLYSNRQIERVLGYAPDEIQAMGEAFFPLLIHPDDLPQVMVNQQRLLSLQDDNAFVETEYRMRHKSGEYRWLLSRDRVFSRTAEGLPHQSLGVATDITHQKDAQAALYHQTERQRLSMAIAQDIRQTLDLDLILQTSVTKVRQFLQTDRVIIYQFEPNWSGSVIAEALAEAGQSILGVQITDTYFVETQGKAHAHGEIVATSDIYTANYSPCHIEWLEQLQVRAKLVVPILQGEHLWGLLVAQHCQAPRQWAALEIELLQHLSTQLAIAIQQAELYRQVQTLNVSLELQVQERTAQLQQALEFEALLKRITDRVRDSLDEGQILQTAVEELAQGLSIGACDAGIYNAEHTTSTIAYEVTNTLTPAQGCTFTIATSPHPEVYPYLLNGQSCQFSDITSRPLRTDQQLQTTLAVPIVDDQGVLGDLWLFKPSDQLFNDQEVRLVQQVANQCAIALRQSRLYQASQEQVQALERLNQLKDDFLSTVSHELRTPMSNIKMATQMLEISLERVGLLHDETNGIHRYFKILREEGQRELALINDLLDLARLDADTDLLTLATIDLRYYLPHLAESFNERTQQQQQHLVLQIPADLPYLDTDLPYLERLLTELLHNACKYTPAGETIAMSARATETALELCVSNSGVEIPIAERDRIFDKFYRIPNNDPWKHGGTGLGLALVKKLTERLGGQIKLESGNGQTTFRLTFGLHTNS